MLAFFKSPFQVVYDYNPYFPILGYQKALSSYNTHTPMKIFFTHLICSQFKIERWPINSAKEPRS